MLVGSNPTPSALTSESGLWPAEMVPQGAVQAARLCPAWTGRLRPDPGEYAEKFSGEILMGARTVPSPVKGVRPIFIAISRCQQVVQTVEDGSSPNWARATMVTMERCRIMPF